MADMKLKITADLDQLRKDIRKAMRERFTVQTDVRGGSSTDGGGLINGLRDDIKRLNKAIGESSSKGEIRTLQKDKAAAEKKLASLQGKGGGLAKSLARLVPLVGIIAAVAQAIKPLIDIVQAAVNLTVFYLFKLIKWLFGGGVWNAIKQGFDWIIKNAILVADTIVGWLKEGWDTIKTELKTIWSNIKEQFPVLQKVEEFIRGLVRKFEEFAKDPLGSVGRAISTAISSLWDEAKVNYPFLKDIEAGVKNTVNWVKNLRQTLDDYKTAADEFFKDPWGDIGGWIEELKKTVVSNLPTLSDVLSALKGLAEDIGSSIRRAIRSLIGGPPSDDEIGDGIVQSGRVVATDPRDTIIAARDLSGMMGGSITINIKGENPSEIASRVKEELARERFRASRF